MRALLLLAFAPAAPALLQAQNRVNVTPREPVVAVGDTLRLSGTPVDSAGRPLAGGRVRWLPGGMNEAEMDSTGLVRGVAIGSAPLYAIAIASDGRIGRPTQILVKVVPGPAARVAITPAPAKLLVGQQVTLGADVWSATGDKRDGAVAWTAMPSGIAAIMSDGRLAARAPGRARITATAGSASTTISVDVVANSVRSATITGGESETRTGDVLKFRAVAKDAAGREVTGLTSAWTIAPGSGLIDQDGSFVANEPGTYSIVADFGSVRAQRTVKVRYRDIRRATTTMGTFNVAGRLTAEFWPHPNGKNAYLSTVSDRLYALDISDPASIKITDSVVVDARHINDVMSTADGKYAVMTRENASSRRNGIVILSLADPAHPKVLSDFTETVTGGVHSAYVSTQPKFGTFVFLTDDATGSMRVIDINTPQTPKEVARWETNRTPHGRYVHDLEVKDGLAYLSYWKDGLIILDVGNGVKGGSPTKPQLVSQTKYDVDALYKDVEAEGGPGYIRGTHTAWRHGNYVFIGDEVFSAKPIGIQMPGLGFGKANGRMQVVDVRDIEHPKIVAWYEPKDGGVHNMWVAGDSLLIGDYQGGLRVVDVSGELRGDLLAQGREMAVVPTASPKGFVPNATMAWGAFYQNGLVWVNDMFSGLTAVRIEPRRPVVVP